MAKQPDQKSASTGAAQLSRPGSSNRSNPDIFSDEYALEPLELSETLSPVDSLQNSLREIPLDCDETTSRNRSSNILLPTSSDHATTSIRPNSISKAAMNDEFNGIPRRSIPSIAQSEVGTHRTVSTSSRFSIPTRPLSPYTGPTAPSQPYAMYSQVTRASSIASENTVRPNERPFVSQQGPEHPYSMYPQNTVGEDDDENVGSGLHTSFPAPSNSEYRTESSSSENDVGDIVGRDGHIEQLPPYTRYADNVVAKGDMARIEGSMLPTVDIPLSDSQPTTSSGTSMEPAAGGLREAEEASSKKEGWIQKSKKRKCCGLPLLTVLLIAGIVCIAAGIGGVIGGVVGTKKAADSASALATTTVWLDADPVTTGPATPTCPTGHFEIPLNQTQEITDCVVDSQYTMSWSCIDMPEIGITLSRDTKSNLQVVFDDYSVDAAKFKYGAQPPDFNGTAFQLKPYLDKDDDELGVAMFFSVLFDKVIILPESTFPNQDSSKKARSLSEPFARDNYNTGQLSIGDEPWYCFWNQTVAEFWIFLNQQVVNGTTMAITSTPTSPPATAAAAATTGSGGPTYYTGPFSPPTPTPSSISSPSMSPPQPAPTSTASWPYKIKKRFAADSDSYYSNLIKMVEKRMPANNINPYCQKMQVLPNWDVCPAPGVPIVKIQESEIGYPQPTSSNSKRSLLFARHDYTKVLNSNCICEWMST